MSLGFFLTHLHQLPTMTLVLLGAACCSPFGSAGAASRVPAARAEGRGSAGGGVELTLNRSPAAA